MSAILNLPLLGESSENVRNGRLAHHANWLTFYQAGRCGQDFSRPPVRTILDTFTGKAQSSVDEVPM